jgi:hypothetical protein
MGVVSLCVDLIKSDGRKFQMKKWVLAAAMLLAVPAVAAAEGDAGLARPRSTSTACAIR